MGYQIYLFKGFIPHLSLVKANAQDSLQMFNCMTSQNNSSNHYQPIGRGFVSATKEVWRMMLEGLVWPFIQLHPIAPDQKEVVS